MRLLKLFFAIGLMSGLLAVSTGLTVFSPAVLAKTPVDDIGCTPGSAGCVAQPTPAQKVACTKEQCDIIGKYLNPAIQVLSAIVGILVTISVVIGAIQYASSGGDPSKVQAAKKRIAGSIIALICFIFLYSFVQFIVPGGIFG